MNRTGGRYYEDPKTGLVTPADPETGLPPVPPPAAEPAPSEAEPSTDSETVAPKAGKKG